MLTFGSDNIYRRIFRYAQQLVQISRHNSLVELLLCVFIYKSPIFFKTFCPRGDNFVNATKCCYIFVAIADSLRGKKLNLKEKYAIYYLQKHVQPGMPEH